jgi:hypothetical protein
MASSILGCKTRERLLPSEVTLEISRCLQRRALCLLQRFGPLQEQHLQWLAGFSWRTSWTDRRELDTAQNTGKYINMLFNILQRSSDISWELAYSMIPLLHYGFGPHYSVANGKSLPVLFRCSTQTRVKQATLRALHNTCNSFTVSILLD